MPIVTIGRRVLGAASIAFGLIALLWHDYRNWDQLHSILNASDGPIFLSVVAAAQIVGGIAMQFGRTARAGATLLGAVYLVFAFACVPRIFKTPQIYDAWGNFFEPFSLAVGALLSYVRLPVGRVLLGVCTVSFSLEQAFYLKPTAELVPMWIPPSQMFWAVTTTVFFALAAVALLANRRARLAARFLAMMIAGFGLLVWVPLLLAHSERYATWSETIETVAIAGVFWILAEQLSAPSASPEGRAAA